MKKFLSLALVIAMMLMMSATVYAGTITNDGSVSGDINQDVTVTYTSTVSYTVTIPDSMTIGDEATISVSEVMIDADQGLSITVASTQYNNGWLLKDQSTNKTVGYTLKNGEAAADIPNNGTVLNTTSGVDKTATLYTEIKRAPLYTGTFTDTLTFSVKIADRDVSEAEARALKAQYQELRNSVTTEQISEFGEFATLATRFALFDKQIQSCFVDKDGEYSQQDVNSHYFDILEIYNTLFDKLTYSNG